MIIIHCAADGEKLLLWGEVPAEVPPAQATRRTEPVAPQPYPFDAGVMRLVTTLVELVPGQPIPGGTGSPPLLWLPTSKGRPHPSGGLIADVPESSPRLAPWIITALPLPTPLAVELLCACVGKEMFGNGVLIGATLAYWAKVLRFAGSLAGREQIVPGLKKQGQIWRACWQPVVTGPDVQRLARLERAMPASCRALNHSADAPPDRSPAELLQPILHDLTDYLVRLAVAGPLTHPATRGGRIHVANFASVHDRWVHALQSGDGVLNVDEAELKPLAEQVRAWQRPITASATTPFHLCFRLEEPSAEDPPNAPWMVQYLLQARDDPSLMIPVSDAWKARGMAVSVFKSRSFEPREYLLTALGQAAGVCPFVEESLKSATPSGFGVDVHGAHRFLAEHGWMLEQAGFAVFMPAWWTRKGTKHRLGVQAEIKSPPRLAGGGGLSLQEMIKFNWRVALGDDQLSLRELELLAKLKAPLVRVRGQWVKIDPGEIRALVDLLKRQAGGEASLREVVQMALGAGEAPGGVPFTGVNADGWVGEFLSRLEGKTPFEDLQTPDLFQGTLRPYQVRGYSWLAFLRQWGLGACLADDMGLGKTIQTLALLQRDWHEHHRPALLICPTSVVTNWKKEAERFTPELPVLIHHGAQRAKGAAFVKAAAKQALVVSSYALLFRDRETLEKVPWAGVILDEAQNIKNADTKQAQAARALKADYRIALTGTPVENHVGDLWSIVEFLNPGWLGTQSEFRKRFFVPIQAQQDAEAAMRLKRLTGPFLLRRLKTDRSIISDLPDKMEMKVFSNLTREQATLYASVVAELDESLKSAEGIQRKGIILATLTRLKQVCNHPAHFLGDGSEIEGRSGKLARLTEMLEEVQETGERALIFTQFTEMGDLLKQHLQNTFGREVLFLHGGVSRTLRTRMVERFQNEEDGPRLFILSLKAGGTGLNLTAATHVFHFDRWWNPAVENQATDRAFRIGQTKNVQVHKFVCAGTVEEKIDDMIEKKQRVASAVVSTGEGWLTELSNDQLRDLFELRQDAIGD